MTAADAKLAERFPWWKLKGQEWNKVAAREHAARSELLARAYADHIVEARARRGAVDPTRAILTVGGLASIAEQEARAEATAERGEALSELLRNTPQWSSETFGSAERLISTARKSTMVCQGSHAVTVCKCGPKLVNTGCDRADCLRCAKHVTQERARRAWEKVIGSVDGERERLRRAGVKRWDRRAVAVCVSEFTLPPVERARFTRPTQLRELRRELWHLLRDRFGATWACIAVHPVGDSDPDVFHPHFHVLWGRLAGRGWLNACELIDAWAELLQVEPGADQVASEKCGHVHPVDVHHSYVRAGEEKELRHHVRYNVRVFAGWKRWMPKAVQWYGDYPRGLVVTVCCKDCEGNFQMVHFGDGSLARVEALRVAWVKSHGAIGPPGKPSSRVDSDNRARLH